MDNADARRPGFVNIADLPPLPEKTRAPAAGGLAPATNADQG